MSLGLFALRSRPSLIHAGFSKGSAYYVNRKFEKSEKIYACMCNKKKI